MSDAWGVPGGGEEGVRGNLRIEIPPHSGWGWERGEREREGPLTYLHQQGGGGGGGVPGVGWNRLGGEGGGGRGRG